MRNTKLKRSRWSSFLSGKGFYIALFCCIAVVSVTAYFVISSAQTDLSEQNSKNQSIDTSSNEWGFSDTQTGQSQSGVVKESSSSSSSSSESSSSESAEQANTSSTAQKTYSGTFVLPLQGDVINAFSNGKPVKSVTMNDWRTHDGIDIKAAVATPVKASSDGTVTSIAQDSMWGVVITIDHGNGYQTVYSGLNVNVSVKKGDEVDIGTVIGSVGETALVEIGEEPHLHFAMQKDGQWIDPMSKIANK